MEKQSLKRGPRLLHDLCERESHHQKSNFNKSLPHLIIRSMLDQNRRT